MKCMGTSDEIGIWEDEWTIVTTDKALSGVFEHTILITEDSHEVLTLADENAQL